MTYSIVYEGVTFTIPADQVDFHQSSLGLEAIVRGTNPSIMLQSTLEFLQEHSLISSLNLSEKHFAFWIVDGFGMFKCQRVSWKKNSLLLLMLNGSEDNPITKVHQHTC